MRDIAILPQVSVIPYELNARQPNMLIAFLKDIAGIEAPPHEIKRKLDKSKNLMAGLSTRRANKVAAIFVTVTRSRSI